MVFLASVAVIFSFLAATIFITGNASAGREVNSRLSNGNASVYCVDGTKGMVWLTNDGSDYYSERVIVGEGQTWVGVQVHGAVNACSSPPQSSDIETYAAGVRPEPVSAGVLSINGNEFYRGNLARGAVNGWSFGHDDGRPGTYLDASLNVSGVAPCSAAVNQVATGSVYVEIYRYLRYRQFGNIIDKGDGVERFTVPVTRNCPLDFSLTPTISVTPSTVESGTPVTASPNVNNTGTTQSASAQWQVTRFRVNPGLPIPGAAQNGTVPVSYYANGAVIVNQGTSTFPRNNTALAATSENIDDLPPGTRVCYALSVQPISQSDGRWNHSIPACVVVATKPKVQILGGDLIVGRGSAYNPAQTSQVATSTSFSTSTGRNYGSWSEYAIIPSGTVRGMASGALLVDGAASSDLCSLSLLTLSNNNGSGCNSGSIGNYAYSLAAPNVATRFPVTNNISGSSVDIRSLTSGQVYSVSGSTLNITSSQPIPGGNATTKGKWVVINDPDATVTISSNINYANTPLNQIDDIPQVVIIARNILIAENVTNVDAWLIATGTGADGIINTCSAVAAGSPTTLNASRCNNATPLTINGPVLANHLYLYRTTGSGIDDPAEIFNLRADAYVWSSAYSPGNGRIPTVSTKELPPRF